MPHSFWKGKFPDSMAFPIARASTVNWFTYPNMKFVDLFNL